MNRIRGPREADPTKEYHRYLRALPEGNHFIEVTFRNIRTGESYPPKPHGRVFPLTPDKYEWLSERHPLPDTPEEALACLLQIALEGKVTPQPHTRRRQDYVAVFNKYHNAFFRREERGAKLARTKKKLIQDWERISVWHQLGRHSWPRSIKQRSREINLVSVLYWSLSWDSPSGTIHMLDTSASSGPRFLALPHRRTFLPSSSSPFQHQGMPGTHLIPVL